MSFPKVIELSQGKNFYFPIYHFWVPDFSDFSLPRKKDGGPYDDPEDFEAYLNWLVVHLETNDLPLNPHHQEIITSLNIQDEAPGLLGLWLAEAAISQYYFFVDPRFDYPEDFLLDPRPERVCNPASVKFDDTGIGEDGSELVPGMIKLQTYLIFNFMCWQADKEYQIKKAYLPEDATIFNDIGWRPLLKAVISRTNNWWEKRQALKRFHEEFGYLCQK